MKTFLAFVKKESKHIFRDYRTMMVLFIMPVAQILIFGFVISTEIRDARIGVLNKANDHASHRLVQRLVSSGYFKVYANYNNEREVNQAFRRGEIQMTVVIEPGFGNNLKRPNGAKIQLLADASDANTAQMLVNFSQGIIAGFGREQMPSSVSPILTTEVRMFYNPQLKAVYMSIPGTMAMVLILISAMMTSISITREKELGSMEVLLISPLKPYQIILGKVTPYVLLSMINAITIMALGIIVFKMPMLGSWIWLFVINLLYIMLSLALGILISTLAKNQMVAMLASFFGLLLPTILLSGFIFPIENMVWPLQWLSRLVPPRYYVEAVKTVMLKGGGLQHMWAELLTMTGFLVFFLTLSIRNFKTRLE
jgi:ABC-2 type transport system permease protein